MNRHHYMPTAAQQVELLEASLELKAKTAAAREQRLKFEVTRRTTLDMLAVVIGVKPMDNPFVNTHLGDLE
jgi:hypothetical protein